MDNLFETSQMLAPFWQTREMKGEPLLFLEKDGKIFSSLRFRPSSNVILRDYTGTKEYHEGKDFIVEGKTLVRIPESSLPFWKEEQLLGEGIPAPFREVKNNALSVVETDYCIWPKQSIYTESPFFYGHQVNASYSFDEKELAGFVPPSYLGESLPHFEERISQRQPIKLLVIGDSVSDGCSSSAAFHHSPFQRPFPDLFALELERRFGLLVPLVNQSVGGMTSAYTADDPKKLEAMAKENADLLLIHYGINDWGEKTTPEVYAKRIETIIRYQQSHCPSCDILLTLCFPPHPHIYDNVGMRAYAKKLEELAQRYNQKDHGGVAFLDVHRSALSFLQGKRYEDFTGNGINHPGDFGHRFYVMCLLSSLLR